MQDEAKKRGKFIQLDEQAEEDIRAIRERGGGSRSYAVRVALRRLGAKMGAADVSERAVKKGGK